MQQIYWNGGSKNPLYLHTEGGDMDVAVAAIERILETKKPARVITTGQCSSAGIPIILAVEKRYSLPFCRFMTHPIGAKVCNGDKFQLLTETQEILLLDSLIKALWSWRGCGPGPDPNATVYFDAVQAKKYKLVHDIIDLPFQPDQSLFKNMLRVQKYSDRDTDYGE